LLFTVIFWTFACTNISIFSIFISPVDHSIFQIIQMFVSMVSPPTSCFPHHGTFHLNNGYCDGGVHVAWSLVFCVVFCRLLFVLFLLAIVLSTSSI
jgi:hypothetical protein